MQDTLFARQAIYNQALDLVAYELLFRSNDPDFAQIDNNDEFQANAATSSVIINIFSNVGADNVVGQKEMFINFSRKSLIDGLPELLPANRMVIEILEGMTVDEHLIDVVIKLKEKGYKIALDDFIFDKDTQQLIDLVDIIKVDVLGLNESEIIEQLGPIKGFKGTLLAEKIEDYEQFECVKSLGFDLFQGFFLSKPTAFKGKKVKGNRANTLQLLSALNDEDVQLKDVEKIILRDPSLSYRLLMIVNSAAYYLAREISTLHEAIYILGIRTIRNWIMLFVLERLDAPSRDILERTVVRAKMCEILTERLGYEDNGSAYTLGLLSTLDILFEDDMETLLEKISLSDEIIEALLEKKGFLGEVIDNVILYEKGLFHELYLANTVESDYYKAYLMSLRYANWTLTQISE